MALARPFRSLTVSLSMAAPSRLRLSLAPPRPTRSSPPSRLSPSALRKFSLLPGLREAANSLVIVSPRLSPSLLPASRATTPRMVPRARDPRAVALAALVPLRRRSLSSTPTWLITWPFPLPTMMPAPRPLPLPRLPMATPPWMRSA